MGDWGQVAVMPEAGVAGYRVRMALSAAGGHIEAHLTGTARVGFCTFGFASTSTPSATEGEARPWVLMQATRAGLVGSMSISSVD